MISHQQKVLIHAKRVLEDPVAYPVCCEIHPTSFCPHDCLWCYNKPERQANPHKHVDFNHLSSFITDMVGRGLKAVQITGGGEPLVYRHIDELLDLVNRLGLEVALETNGEYMDRVVRHVRENWKYVRFSFDAYDRDVYARTRTTDPGSRKDYSNVFDRVQRNIGVLMGYRHVKALKFRMVLGYVVHESNYDLSTLMLWLDRCDEMGIDLIQMRPDFTNLTENRFDFSEIVERAKSYRNLKVTVSGKIAETKKREAYGTCLSSYLNTVVYYSGDVNMCCIRPELTYGNISEGFEPVWKRASEMISKVNTAKCPVCRFHGSNALLHKVLDTDNHHNML